MVLSFRLPPETIEQRVHRISDAVLEHSRCIREANFTKIHPRDLEFLFAAYDDGFFGSLCRQVLSGHRIRFRLSPRMTRSGGSTTRFRAPTGEVSYEIAIAVSMLFNGFDGGGREVTVGGLECRNRLEALQRIFEHEMVHLAEQLCWGTSDCAAPRFQDIASRMFLHQAHTHQLVTWRERAAQSGIRVGSRVSFEFEGQRLNGRVNRITKRVTVLVEHPEGQAYSNGLRYKTYYVPMQRLELV